jgi:hypothetical protein
METFRNTFTNSMFKESYNKLNKSNQLTRTELLNNYNTELIDKAWELLCKSIAQNYQSGKGTIIPKFGTFTFNNSEVNLEGTTNQFNRDLKAKKPVFVVSSDFVERLKPGMFGNGGIIYYTQKINNNVGHVKVNYAQIAYSLNAKKEDCGVILDNLIRLIGDSIVKVSLRFTLLE